MDVKVEYEKIKASFDFAGKQYSGEIICSETKSKTYWFVFDQIDVKPFGGSIEFKMVNGVLQVMNDFPGHESFLQCIKEAIEKYRKELCN